MPEATDDQLALFLQGWLAGLCKTDACPIHVDHVATTQKVFVSGGPNFNEVINFANPDGSYDKHFDVVTGSGVKIRVSVEVLEDHPEGCLCTRCRAIGFTQQEHR